MGPGSGDTRAVRCSPLVAFVLVAACGGSSPPKAAPPVVVDPADASVPLAIWGPYAAPTPNPSDVPYDPPPPDPTPVPTATAAPAASTDDASQPWNRKPSAAEVKACAARGGKLQPVCMSGAIECVIHYRDAGKACKDKKDCIGGCYYMGNDAERGKSVIGNCEPTSDPCGCKTIVENGKVGSSICTD